MSFSKAVFWLLAYSFFWLMLSDGERDSLWFGLFAVAIAFFLRWRWHQALPDYRRLRLNPFAWGRFLMFFLVQSFKGGLSTARLALLPGARIRETFIEYDCSLPEGPARVFLVQLISLLPGTLSVALSGRTMEIHLLEHSPHTLDELRGCERRVQMLYKEP